jgi:NAD(P)-dependent dehydrogenase (short-subunit alcohol dehydrogenase family)
MPYRSAFRSDLFAGQTVVVTGGGSGIGRCTAHELAALGAKVLITGRKIEKLAAVEAEIREDGGAVASYAFDIRDEDTVRAQIRQMLEAHGIIHGLVNNAGVNDGVGLENGNYEKFMASLHTNVVHYYLLAHFALPELIRAKGSIVNIASKTAITGQGNTSAYAASNGGRIALTREWAVELLKYNIRVNAVIVSESYTPAYEKWIKTLANPEEKLKEIESKIPLGNRMTKPEEIANAVVFLLSSKSSHTTGQLVYVDGGYVHLDRALANA